MAAHRRWDRPAASLPGPAREITVEPLEAPVEQPSPVELPPEEPRPVEEPAPAPEPERAPA